MHGPAWELSEGDRAWVHAVNLWGGIHVMRAFVPLMLEQNAGHLHFTVSNMAVTVRTSLAAHTSSKHALLAMAEALAPDLRGLDEGRFYVFTDLVDAAWVTRRGEQIVSGWLVEGTPSALL